MFGGKIFFVFKNISYKRLDKKSIPNIAGTNEYK
jgi:hypothetical protein